MRALGLRTDLMVQGDEAKITTLADRYIWRTPSAPDFWFGNTVVFRAPPTDARACIAQFQADFPQARHICLQWDVPDMPDGPALRDLAAMGLELDVSSALTRQGAPLGAPRPEGIALRPVVGADWAQVAELKRQTSAGAEAGEAAFAAYIAARVATWRARVERGEGVWIGAFDGSVLVGHLGLIQSAGLARYQDVVTRASHRRRGIAAALLGAAAEWAVARDAQVTLVIVADTDDAPERLYLRQGFERRETLRSAVRPALPPP